MKKEKRSNQPVFSGHKKKRAKLTGKNDMEATALREDGGAVVQEALRHILVPPGYTVTAQQLASHNPRASTLAANCSKGI